MCFTFVLFVFLVVTWTVFLPWEVPQGLREHLPHGRLDALGSPGGGGHLPPGRAGAPQLVPRPRQVLEASVQARRRHRAHKLLGLLVGVLDLGPDAHVHAAVRFRFDLGYPMRFLAKPSDLGGYKKEQVKKKGYRIGEG